MKQILHNLKSNSGYQIRVLLILVLFPMFTNFASAQATTPIPDPNFEQALIDLLLDSGPIDGEVLTSNISSVAILDIRDKGITNLAGIEDFTSLEELFCNNESVGFGNDNAITTLDVSGFPNLIRLYCQNNQITDLNISGLTKLEALDTSNNPFIDTTLDVHLNPNLYYLVCQNNGLTDLNISGLTSLQTLIVWDNQLTLLDVSNNLDLTYLDCDDNLFTSLDVTGLTKLDTFYCSGNQLSSINVSEQTNLRIFFCYSNTPAGIDIFVNNVPAAYTSSITINPDSLDYYWRKDPVSVYTYCQSGLTTTWTSALGGSWDNGVPTSETAAIISYNYSEAANIDACSLTINGNAIVTIPSSFKVTLNAPITVEAGSSFTLSNDVNLIQTNKLTVNSGDITVNRNSSLLKRLDYTLWSSPVSGAQTLANFSPLTTQSPSRFYSFDTNYNTGGVNGAYSTIASPTTATFSAGAGYMIRMPNTNPLTGYDAGTATLAYPGVFTGLPNNGDIPVNLSYIDAPRSYNLVGNPYPTVIDADTFINANTANIENTLYFWRKTNGASGSAYATYTEGGGTTTEPGIPAPNGKIQIGQGFFVQAKSAVTVPAFFTNTMREASPSSTQFFKTKKVAEKDRVWLNLTNTTGVFSQTLVAYLPDATSGVDRYDGKYINDSKIALTSNINNEEYTIQSRPAFDVSDVVALNLKTNIAGDYTIAIDHADGLFANGQDVYLVDSKTGTETNLKTSSYTFAAVSGVDNTRFSLKYQKTLKVDAPVFNENSVTVYRNNGVVYVNSKESIINNIKVYDVQGRLIAEQKNVKASTATINNLKTIHQVLIVKVTSEDNKVISKKVAN